MVESSLSASRAELESVLASASRIDLGGQIVRTAIGAGWLDRPVSAEAADQASELSTKGGAGFLKALLLAPAWQITGLPGFDRTPLRLWSTLAAASFRLPRSLSALGQADAIARHQLLRLGELALLAERNPGSQSVREAADEIIKAGSCELLACAGVPLGKNLALRGRIRRALNRPKAGDEPPVALDRRGRRLKIGAIVPALVDSRGWRALFPFIESLDPDRFEVTVCHGGGPDPKLEAQLADCGLARLRLPDEFEARFGALRGELLDIALVVTCATEPSDPGMRLLDRRFAPLQMAIDENGGTSGSAGADARFLEGAIGDEPAGSGGERLLLLPSAGIGLLPGAGLRHSSRSWSREGLGLPEDAVLFATVAPFRRLSPEWADAAARILRQTEGSRLLLYSHAPEDGGAEGLERLCAVLEQPMAANGIEASRLLLSNEELGGLAEIVSLLGIADLYLDVFPAGGDEGSRLALEAGLPVLSPEARLGWRNSSEWVDEAVRLGRDPSARRELRANLAGRLADPGSAREPLAYAEAVGLLLEAAFDENGRNRAPLALSAGPLPEEAIAEASLLIESGLAAEARPRLSAAFAVQPGDGRLRPLFYETLIRGGQPRRAAAALEKCAARGHDLAGNRRLLARALQALGRSGEAVEALRASLRADARNPESWSCLRDLAAATGKPELAAEVERWQELLPGASGRAPRAPGKCLYFSPVGRGGKGHLARILERFPRDQFDFLIVNYDESDFSDLGAEIEILRDRGQKWRLIKKHLTPERVEAYDYVFIWDDDIDPGAFDPAAFLDILRRNALDIAQPSLSPDSYSFHPITVTQPNRVGRLTNFVEIMCPAYSSRIWPLVYPYLDPDINEFGWGYDFIPLGKKGIVDCLPVRHTRPGQSGRAGALEQCQAWCRKYRVSRPPLLELGSLS